MEHLTPKQVARAIGVSDASLKRWCDRGVIPTVRTAGGHRRLPLHGVLTFIRESGRQIVRPEILGLPPTTGMGRTVMARASTQMAEALLDGDEEKFQRIVYDLNIARHKVRDICDKMVTPALHCIGSTDRLGQVELYKEVRACEICIRTLHRLHAVFDRPRPDAPHAIGGTPETDPYNIASLMTELALRELGWRAESLGSGLPLRSLVAAVRDLKPRLVWLSVTAVNDIGWFLSQFPTLWEACEKSGAVLVAGGAALDPGVRSRMRVNAFCDTLESLADYVGTLPGPRLAQDAQPA